ncbi:ATP-binding protein [Maritimibacter sp. UBA3975]|uniref:sensor histidine kinase n=1 Tax=Maritimibacter sp. UBA3975 TaxID=1946833 RepID=UPI000C0ADB73|nr:ATP-binding protein [Maritimibacter sp. UBA3975]MAM62062.1 ATPase [Maritimibacter sp.]|tara:strand:- start:5817 stop:8030 length:2214 start_codon:yes stop_codon:yes gene_type:complete
MVRLFAPVQIFFGMGLLALAIAAGAILLATSQPWLGLDLGLNDAGDAVIVERSEGPSNGIAEGERLTAIGPAAGGAGVPVTPATIIEEPDQLSDFDTLDAFRADQAMIAAALRTGPVTLTLVGAEGVTRDVTVAPDARRPLTDLPGVFWLQVFVGLSGMFVGAWIWSLAPSGRPQAFVMLTGLGLAISATAASVYSTREIALPLDAYQWLAPLNLLGSLTFGAGMIGLFLGYPAQIGPRWLALFQAGVIYAWFAGAVTRLIPDYVAAFQLPIAVAMLVLVGLILTQFWRARRSKDLPARAALRLFGLSILIGAGSFVGLITVPAVLGLPAQLSQSYAFGLFLICFIGLALAVRRHRIFNLEIWSFRILFFAAGALLLIALDAVLIYGLALDRAPALGVSLFLVAFLYLPLRDGLARRLARWRGQKPLERYFRDVSRVAMTKDAAQMQAAWDDLLQGMFEPLAVEPGPEVVQHAALEAEGVDLVLPPIPPIASRRLKWGRGGRRLFTDVDVQRAEELVGLLAQLIEGREAYETGASEERTRIARDIHDNIGIQLLGALHSKDAGRKDVLIRETLADLREIIDNQTGPGLDLGNLIADLRLELTGVLEGAEIAVDWPLGADLSGYSLSPRMAHTLRSVLREAVNNAVRHSDASTVGVYFTVSGDTALVDVRDDGRGFDMGEVTDVGQGMRNMQVRVSALGGRLNIGPARDDAERPGTLFHVELPLIEIGMADDIPEAAQ